MRPGDVIRAVRQRGWKVFDRPFELNIIGVRDDSTRPNAFDDRIIVAYADESGRMAAHSFPATTDPGTFWLRQPMHPQGTAILAQGQYLDAYKLGIHRGQYPALVQQGKVRVIRDYDRDAVLDFANGNESAGHFGINIHRASSNGLTRTVDRHSAGCQVFADAGDFERFMRMCARHRELHGNRFSYSLIDRRAARRATRRRVALAGAAFAIAAVSLAVATTTQD
jgi:hypothetical protein